MADLITEFIANTFNCYYYFTELEELECNYESIYTENPNKEDNLSDFEYQLFYGITYYYIKNKSRNLICIEHHHGIESEFQFTEFGFDYFKTLFLNYINSKLQEFSKELKYDKAFKDTIDEYAEVFQRLADS